MGTIIFIIILIALLKNFKKDNRQSPVFKWIFGTIIGVAALSAFLPVLGVLGVFGLLGFGIYKLVKKNQDKNQQKTYGWDAGKVNKTNPSEEAYKQYVGGKKKKVKTSLPESPSKRKKIVEQFNSKYNLYLTAEQIQSIVNSSYMSEIWRKEVEAMNEKYDSVYEWYQGYTKWLRVYLSAFHVQEVTSDVRQQEIIVTYAFEEVFKYVDGLAGMPLSEKIAHVNDKFYASFDDASFMIAYRFLESKGKHHDLTGSGIIRDDEEIDELLKKYEMPEEKPMN